MINALGETEKEAVAKWNTRPLESSLESQIASQAEDIRKLTEDAERLASRLIEYANCDSISAGNGYGCMTDPDEFIKRHIDQHNALMSTLKGDGE
jgi:hypothetical protein